MNASTVSTSRTSSNPMLAHHLDLMFQQSNAVFGGNFVMVLLSVIALWNMTDIGLLLTWAALIVLLTLLRIAFITHYRRVRPTPREAPRWAWAFTVTSMLSGILWGSMAFLFFDTEQPLSVLFVCWAIAGMTTAAVPTLSNFLPAYAGFAIPAVLPYAARSLFEGGTVYPVFGILALYFLAANLVYARSSNRNTAESIRLRFENLALLEQLQVEKERAENANNAKTKFLAAASHDLRQPTHAMGLFVGAIDKILRRGEPGPLHRTLVPTVDRMKTTLKGMGNLLNSLLDASRLEAGAVPVERRPIRLQELFDRLHGEFYDAARRKGLELRFRPTRLAVESDAVLLGRMLSNLISNAIKYTKRGHVLIGCRRRGSRVEIQVHDTGIGIAKAHHDSIFEEFVQLDNTARNREQGLGLGLSIVRRTAQLLSHEIRVRSRLDVGSVFSIQLPRTKVTVPARETAMANTARPATPGGTVIVVDDDTSAREAIEDLLLAHGYDVIAASSIEEIRAHLSGARVDATMIIVDYRLGEDVTGVQAVRAIQPLLKQPARAIIVTGDTSPDRIREAESSGYPLLHKPLEAETLLNALQMRT